MVISDDLRRVLDTAARSNVSIYAIDPTGDPNQPSSGGVKPQPMLADENPFDNKHQQNRLMLQALAVSTGGVALTRSNDFAATLAKVVADTSSYYLLGFVSTNAAQDGTYRKIEVRPVRAGLKVQARSGYTARNSAPVKGAAPLISATLSELMSTPAQVSGLSMGVAAPAYMGKGSKAQVEVIVELAGSDIMPDANAAPSDKPLEVLIAIADADGRVKAKEQGSLQLNFSAPVRAQISQYGLRLMSRLDVAPGRYLLRIAGTEPGGSARGSVQYDLDVPDFSKARLSMSGLALASSTELRRATTGSDAEWKRRFPLAPTTVRVFPVGAELSVAGEIYALDKPAAGIVITTAVRNESGDVVARHEETLTNADSGKPATYRHQTEFSLLGFAPGAYVLSVEARTSTAPKPVTRDIPFSVR
jgi:hypothetical protein